MPSTRRLPPEWAKYFAVGQRCKLGDLEGNPQASKESTKLAGSVGTAGWGYLCLIVLPMGLASAVGIMQAIHRRVMTMPKPKPMGAGLPNANDIRKTAVLLTNADQWLAAAWQVYLDNLAMVEVEKRKNLPQLEGAMSDWHQAARLAWDKRGIPSAKDKSVAKICGAKELGCFIDADNGLLGTDIGRRLIVIMATLFLIGVPLAT